MAKKVIVPPSDDQASDGNTKSAPVKKKRSVCCTCCLVVLIVVIIILAAAFGVGWYFGDKLSKQYLDMSLGDTVGVVNDLYWTKDKHVVTDPFTDDDIDGFFAEIKKNMILKEDVDIDFNAALIEALNEFGLGDAVENTGSEASLRTTDGSVDESDAENADGSQSAIMNVLLNMITSVFNRDNIDVERLKNYSETHDEYIFNLRDKELASFIDTVLKAILSSDLGAEMLGQLPVSVKLDELVALKQIKFKAQSAVNEIGETYITATLADITVWVGVQDAAGQALTDILDQNGFGWASGIARWLGNVFLPKNLYVTLSVPLDGDADTDITLNDMTESKRDRAYKLVNGILSVMDSRDSEGNVQTVQGLLGGVTEKIEPVMQAAADTADFSTAAQGTIKLDLIDTLVKSANTDLSEGDPLTKADFMYLLQVLFTSDAQARLDLLQDYLYDKWYVDGDGNYFYDPPDKDGMEQVDYVELFIEEIEQKYAVNLGEGEDRELSKVLAMLGISLDGSSNELGSKDLFEYVDANRLNAELDSSDEEIKLRITDRMLAALLTDQLGGYNGGADSAFGSFDLGVDALTFTQDPEYPDRTFAMLVVNVSPVELIGSLGGDNVLARLAANLLPEKFVLTVNIDITQSLSAGERYLGSTYLFNDYENTDRVISTLGKLIPSLDLDSMTDQLATMLRDMVLKLDEAIGIELVPTDAEVQPVKQGELVMPGVFDLITNTFLIDDDTGEPVELKTNLRNVLNALNNHSGVSVDHPIADNYSDFINKIVDMYYLDMQVTDETTFSDITSFIEDGEQGFSADKFRVKEAEGESPVSGVTYLIYDKRRADELKPNMSAAEIGRLIESQMSDDIGSYNVLEVATTSETITVKLSISIDDLLPEQAKKLFICDEIYVTVTVGLNDVQDGAYKVDARINSMDEDTYADMMAIMRIFNADFDIDGQVAEFGKILYDQIQSLKDSLGGDEFVKFTDDGLVLASFYEYLANKMELDMTHATPETVKLAVQGMYMQSDVEEFKNEQYNYSVNDIITNRGSDVEMSENEYIAAARDGIVDTDFNGYFQGLINGMADNSVDVVQTVVLNEGEVRGNIGKVRAWLNAKLDGEPVDTNGNYMAVTFKMYMDEFMTSDKSSSAGFLPEYIYATAVIEYDASDNEYESIGIVFNNMDSDVYELLLQLMGLSPDTTDESKVNITTVTQRAVDGLNTLAKTGTFEFDSINDGNNGIVKYVSFGA